MTKNSKQETTDAGVQDAVTNHVHGALVAHRPEDAERLATEDAHDPGEK
jgi:hypothetical protein